LLKKCINFWLSKKTVRDTTILLTKLSIHFVNIMKFNALKNQSDRVKSVIVIVLVIGVILGLLGLGLLFKLSARVVESGSMCVPYNGACDGLLSLTPFNKTLHRGDLIIIQGVNPEDLNANYPNSDIIVYQKPDNLSATPIVHRIVSVQNIDGTLYFQTKGDGNGQRWPTVPSPNEYDSRGGRIYQTGGGNGVPENLVLGRVVMRVPFIGWITLILNDNHWVLPMIIGLILLLIVLEFVIPITRKVSKEEQTKEKKVET
jgi:signal peptidase I